jgi:1-acyl-sn-glycerol-3-phosphate acyltransferase
LNPTKDHCISKRCYVKEHNSIKYPSQLVMDFLRFIAYVISKTCWFIRYKGIENIPPKDFGGFVISANHQTYIDPVWICLSMRRKMRFMAYDKAFQWRFIGPFITYLGAFPVSTDGGETIKAVKEALRSLRDGAVLTVFPEGAREFSDGQMLAFKTGAVQIAYQAGVPILPVTIRGGNSIWPRGRKYPRLFRRVEVIYHPMFDLRSSVDDKHADLELWTEEIRNVIGSSTNNTLE